MSWNFHEQALVARDNTKVVFWEWGQYMPMSIKKKLLDRSENIQMTGGNEDYKRKCLEIQRDLWACILLLDNWFDFLEYQWNTTDLYEIAEDFIKSKWTAPTDLSIQFSPMVQDALKAIKTDGAEPPAKDMVRAKEYFANKAQVAVENTSI